VVPQVPISAVARYRRKFLRIFPDGFQEDTYLAWERNYRWEAQVLLEDHEAAEIAAPAVGIEARTHLVHSFEKMALRDAVRSPPGAFPVGL
jgi:hypothetical protein